MRWVRARDIGLFVLVSIEIFMNVKLLQYMYRSHFSYVAQIYAQIESRYGWCTITDSQ